MSRAQQYYDNAARQRAYRERKRNATERNVTFIDLPTVDDLLGECADASAVADALSLYFTPDGFLAFARAIEEQAERRRYPNTWAALDEERARKANRNTKRNAR